MLNMDSATDFLHISDLIVKSFTGVLTEAEAHELKCWRDSAESHERLYMKIISLDYLEEWQVYQKLFSSETASKELAGRLHFRKPWRRLGRQMLKYAAVFIPVVLMLAGGWLYFYEGIELHKETGQLARTFSPGSPRAVLVLDDGTEVCLEKGSRFVAGEAEVDNTDNSGTISYRKNNQKTDGKIKMNRLIVPRGGEYHVELADGTMVYLNAETEFCYPVSFQRNYREVSLKGEGYFMVAHDQQKPFIVKTEGMNVRVLGTEFNLNAYAGQNYVETTLVEGQVEVERPGKEAFVLKPDHQAFFDRRTSELTCLKVNTLPYTAWKDGKFVFNHEEMRMITSRLEKWYDVKFTYTDEQLKDYKVFGIVSRYQDIGQVLELIRATRKIDFEYQGNYIVVKPYK